MSEQWTSPKWGPYPSAHYVVAHYTSRGGIAMVRTFDGRRHAISLEQIAALTAEPPPTNVGPTCETCLRLANRASDEDGSTWTEA